MSDQRDQQVRFWWLTPAIRIGNWKFRISFSTLGLAVMYGENWLDFIIGPLYISYDRQEEEGNDGEDDEEDGELGPNFPPGRLA